MKVGMGTDNTKQKKDISTCLKKGDIVYSCGYDASTDKVDFSAYEFIEYIKGVTFENKEVSARFFEIDPANGKHLKQSTKKDEEPKDVKTVLNVSFGLYQDKREALDEFGKGLKHIVDVISQAKQDLVKGNI